MKRKKNLDGQSETEENYSNNNQKISSPRVGGGGGGGGNEVSWKKKKVGNKDGEAVWLRSSNGFCVHT